jgi:hypothetical protein
MARSLACTSKQGRVSWVQSSLYGLRWTRPKKQKPSGPIYFRQRVFLCQFLLFYSFCFNMWPNESIYDIRKFQKIHERFEFICGFLVFFLSMISLYIWFTDFNYAIHTFFIKKNVCFVFNSNFTGLFTRVRIRNITIRPLIM